MDCNNAIDNSQSVLKSLIIYKMAGSELLTQLPAPISQVCTIRGFQKAEAVLEKPCQGTSWD
jgi:hypothetical protein